MFGTRQNANISRTQYDLSLQQFVGNVSVELSSASEAEKNILSLPLMYYATWQKELQQNLICL